jgi:hypothetical protein
MSRLHLNLRYPEEMERGSFSVIRRKGTHRRLVPEFVNNVRQLQHVLGVRAWRFLHKRKPAPPAAELIHDWRKLDAEVTAALTGRKVLFAGTYITGQAAVAYSAWRMGTPNRELAEQYSVSESTIECLLRGLVDTANALGYPTGSTTPKRKYKRKRGVRTKEEWNRNRPRQRKSATRSQSMTLVWARRKSSQSGVMSGEQYGRASSVV